MSISHKLVQQSPPPPAPRPRGLLILEIPNAPAYSSLRGLEPGSVFIVSPFASKIKNYFTLPKNKASKNLFKQFTKASFILLFSL